MVAKRDAEIGYNQVSQVVAQPSVELIGPLPALTQNYTLFAGGIVSTSKQSDVASALIAFLSSPAAAVVLKMRGFEPRFE